MADAESLLQVLKKNKRRLKEHPSRRKFKEVLRQEFEDLLEIFPPRIT